MSNNDPLVAPPINDLHLGALRDVAHTASRRAATALSRLAQRPIALTVPEFLVAMTGELPALTGYGETTVAAIVTQLLGDVSGSVLLLLSPDSAQDLCAAFLQQPPTATSLRDPKVQSCLMEVAHVIFGAYAEAFASLTEGVVMLSVPAFDTGTAAGFLLHSAAGSDPAGRYQLGVCVTSQFDVADGGLAAAGHLVILPHHPTFGRILRALRS